MDASMNMSRLSSSEVRGMANALIGKYLDELRDVLGEIDLEAVDHLVEMLWEAYRGGRRIFIIGNGGSAATASHMMCDLSKGCAAEGKPRIKALSLTDNVSVMTAISNDISYEKVFTVQLEPLLEEGDLVLAITGSGNSPNVLDAIEYANRHGAKTAGFIGFGGGKLKPMVDADVTLASCSYGHVEDVHCILEHLVSQCLRERIQEL
jgi:D-sedoheptulose 7-phosphate isomerase